jgi:predicted phage tail protein
MSPKAIRVLAAPHLDPGTSRIEIDLPEGLTLQEIIVATLPGFTASDLAQCRIALVTEQGSDIVEPEFWHRARPRPGVRVVIRMIAGKNSIKTILTVVVAIAAIAAGAYFAGPAILGLSGGAYALVSAATTLAVSVVGNLLINSLIPPVSSNTESRNAENRYAISGWRNSVTPNGAVPVILGRVRIPPPFAALSFTEIVGDFQFLRSFFCVGEGQVGLSDIRIGETAISEFQSVDIETRWGVPGDAPITLYPTQIAEESVSVELVRPLTRDELGEVIEGAPSIETPVVRTTGADASGASIILAFPSGLVKFDDKGKSSHETVSVRIEHRAVDAEAWVEVATLNITAKKLESFYRQHSWSFPTRGRWQVRVIMLTDESTDTSRQRRCSWAALQTLRPEYPLNYNRPLALIATRIKATHQLSGALDGLSVLAERYCFDFDIATGTWIWRATSNPASLYRFVLQSAINPKPVGDAGIDIEQLQSWHEFCRVNSLTYSRDLSEAGTTLREVLIEIAAAGRATPRQDGVKWGVTIDRPQELIVDHISPRNSWDFKSRRSYFSPPHAFRVRFKDETNDYKDAERVIRWPGYFGEITLTEALEMPGVTNPAIIWREARRRMYEAIYRPDTYQVTQYGPVRAATRGDRVMLSHDVLDSVQISARIKSVMGSLIELDDYIQMQDGQDYAIRFRVFADEEDTIGTSIVRTVETRAGETRVLVIKGSGTMPVAGELIHFGRSSLESLSLVVTRIEATEDGHSILHLVDEAPSIDQLLAEDEIPAWSGRAGAEVDINVLAPAMPQLTSVTSSGALVSFLIQPGAGTVATAYYRMEHRLGGTSEWTAFNIPMADGGGTITGYAGGDTVQVRARAYSVANVPGPYTATVGLIVGANDPAIPAALDEASINITTLLGGALIQLATGSDAATDQVQVYRSTSGTLHRDTDAAGAPISVSPLQSYSIALGDTTRTNLITDSGFDDPGVWTYDAGWDVASSEATHTPGTVDDIGQLLATQVGKFYRISFDASGMTDGTLTPYLLGGAERAGAEVGTVGLHAQRIQAVTGNTSVAIRADADYDGVLDGLTVYAETAACLPQGTHYIWLEPLNDASVPGPVAGPFVITVV